jgi:hypothetical protein
MAKRQQSIPRIDHVQVDLCPQEAGMILSVGSISMWLPEPTAREVARKLHEALCEESEIVAGDFPRSERGGSN